MLFYDIQISLLTKFNMLLTSFPFLCNIDKNWGEMSEWFKEAVLKTVDAQASRGSNPRFSVDWKGARVAESVSLLRSCTPQGYRGFESPPFRSFLCTYSSVG